MLYVWVKETCVRILSGIVKNVVVLALLGSSFMKTSVSGIFPGEGKRVSYTLQPVLIVILDEASEDNQTTTRNVNETNGSVLALGVEE